MNNKQKSKTRVLCLLVAIAVATFVVLVDFNSSFGRVLGRSSDDNRSNRESVNRGNRVEKKTENSDTKEPDNNETRPYLNDNVVITPKEEFNQADSLTVSPAVNLEVQKESVVTNETDTEDKNKDVVNVESDKTEVVSVSERSVVSSNINYNVPIAAPTKSIFKKIENKIKNVGGSGQFLSKPKTVATPTPIKKDDDSTRPVVLGPDSSIFYMVTDADLLLGAVDKEDKRINVDEAELRGAEITMNKVFAKKGLELGVSSGGSLVLTENGVRSYFELPVFVDVFSHDISVDTPTGKKQIMTTPAKAVVNAIESGYLENVDKKAQMMMGTINGGELAYRLQGDKEFKVFGRFKVKGLQYVYVDVETGEVAEGDQPLTSKLLKLISL